MMISSSPLIAGPDWQSFSQQQQQQQQTSSSAAGQHASRMAPSPSPISPSLPSHSARIWGPNSLGGEALSVQPDRRRNSGLTDPIGSRPGSRTELGPPGANGTQSSTPTMPAFQQQQYHYSNTASPPRKQGSQRASASAAAAVMAAASSAAARSRATSPSNQYVESPGFMGLGTSLNGMNLHMPVGANSSSPSRPVFYPTATPQGLDREGPQHLSGFPSTNTAFSVDAFGMAGTPRLVVEEPDPADESGAGQGHTSGDVSTSGSTKDSGENAPATASPTGNLPSTFARSLGRPGKDDYGFPLQFDANHRQVAAPVPLRSETAGSSTSNLSNFGAAATSSEHLSNFATANLSNSSLQNGGLLSPSAAAAAQNAYANGQTTTGFNASVFPQGPTPFGTHGNLSFGSLTSPTGAPQAGFRFGNASGGQDLLSPGAENFRNGPLTANGGALSEFDAQLQATQTVLDLVERVSRMEGSIRDLNRSISGLNRNVTVLLERTKHLASNNSNAQQQAQQRGLATPATAQSTQMGIGAGGEDLRAMSAQVSILSANVAQLMGQNPAGLPANPAGLPAGAAGQKAPLAGLGLANSTPHFGGGIGGGIGGGSGVTTPQIGTFPGTPAHIAGSRFNTMPGAGSLGPESGLRINAQAAAPGASQHMDRNSRLSPRPGASPGHANSARRWSSMAPGTPDVQNSTGAMNPPDPSVIVSKWEHLNLHNDLLRSILKYGLGPPNKIQQRALPFLLRGSDIIAQAPPTQERIASYVIPVLQLVLNVLRGEASLPANLGVRGPMAIIISTTVDQATQVQRMAMGLGAALGVRVHIAAASSLDVAQEASALIQTQPQIVVGTPQKMMDLFNYLANSTKGAISLDDIRIVVLDEVDQLIARNLADHVSTLLQLLPSPRVIQFGQGTQRPGLPPLSPSLHGPPGSPMEPQISVSTTDRQTAIFSNTVPQDVLNFAQSIHLRESVRVLVRREGGSVLGNSGGSTSSPAGLGGASGQASGFSAPQGNVVSASGGAAGAGPGSSISAIQQPVNALGASPANNHANPLSDPILSSLRGLRQYYLYVAVTTGGGAHSPNPSHGSQIAHAMEMKLDVITDLLEDIDFGHAIVYTASAAAHEAVTYKLASKGIEALGLHKDMASTTRQDVLAKYRSSTISKGANYHAAGHAVVGGVGNSATEAAARAALNGDGHNSTVAKKALVVHDVLVHPKDVHQVPLIVFYDLPRSVEDYKEKIACAASGGAGSRPSVCVNVVTGSGGPRGDIEMLRTLECHLGCKMAELPMNSSQIMQF